MTWFKKRQPRLPLLIWCAPIPDRAFSLFLVFKPGQDSIHLESCFFCKYNRQPWIMLTLKFFRYNTYPLKTILDDVARLQYALPMVKKLRAVRIKERDLEELARLAKKEDETVNSLI